VIRLSSRDRSGSTTFAFVSLPVKAGIVMKLCG
jgi:hypothetical protein